MDRRRIDSLFDAALDLEEPERSAFLDHRCPEGPEREAVVRLLAAAEDGTEDETRILSTAVGERLIREIADQLSAPSEAATGARFGAFRVVHQLGRGGSAIVYLAERADGQFSQRVALKVLSHAARDTAAFDRFQLEREILAALDHPNIARILDGGITADGRPYFALELVDGVPLDAYCTEHRLNVRQRIELFLKVCRAVATAHQRGVVHRDLKPSNILIGKDGEPKLLDFGIAKLVGPAAVLSSPVVTHAHRLPMTPEYASPEQFRGETVTTASDVYQLGLLLYEILTGRRAHSLRGLTPAEAQDVVCARPTTPPSTAVRQGSSEGAAASPGPPAELARQLAGDLDLIALKALRKSPDRRYGSVPQLIEDLQRFLDGRPILARPDSVAYRAYRFAGRHRWSAAAAGLFLLVLAGLVGFYTLRLRMERNLAALEAEKARQIAAFLTGLFEQADPFATPARDLTARQMLDQGADRLSTELAGQPLVRAQMQALLGTIYRRLALYDRARPLLDEALESRLLLLGPDHPETAESTFHRAVLDYNTGRFAEAEAGYLRALEIWEAAGGSGSRDVAQALGDLSLVYRRLSRLEESRAAAERALAILESLPQTAVTDRGRTLNSLALVLGDQGDYPRALRTFQQALAAYAAGPDPEHPSVASVQTNMASTLSELGRLEEAEAAYLAALGSIERRLGTDHPLVAAQLINLGSLALDAGRPEVAQEYLERALPLNQAAYGPQHLRVGLTHLNLADSTSRRGDFAAAFEHLRLGRRIVRATYPAEHSMTAQVQQLEGEILLRQGRPRRALILHQRALAVAQAAAGPAHPMTADILMSLGEAMMALDDPAAEPTLRQALEIRRLKLPADHRHLADSHRRLGLCLEARGRHREAAEQMRSAVAVAEARSSPDDSLLAEIVADAEAFFERWAAAREPGSR